MKRKRGNAKSKTNLAPVCNVDEVVQSVVRANKHLDDTYKFKQNAKVVEPVVEDCTSPYDEPNVVSSSNFSKKTGSEPINSVSSGADQVNNERSQRKKPTLPHQDLQYKDDELNDALAVIRKVMKMDAAAPFNFPVDPVALGIPDYLDVIETPMDFSTVCNNLEFGHKYRNSKDVYGDVQYIWDNCTKYNKKGHYILELLKRVKKNFMTLWTEAGLFTDQQLEINGYSRVPTTKPDMTSNIYGHNSQQPSLSYGHSYQPQRGLYHSPSGSPEPLTCRNVDSLEGPRRYNPCGHGCRVDATDVISNHAQFQIKQHQFSTGNCKSHQPHQSPCNFHPTRDQSQHSHQREATFIATEEISQFPPLRESSARRVEVTRPQCHLHSSAVNCNMQYQTQKRSCHDFDITNAGNCAHQQHDRPSCSYDHRHMSPVETCGDMLSSRKRPTGSAKPHAEEEFRSPPLAESMIRYTKRGPTTYLPRHLADDGKEQDKKSASPVHATSDEPHGDVGMDSSDESLSPHPAGSMISCAKRGIIDPIQVTRDNIRNEAREISETPSSFSQPPLSRPQAPLKMFTTVPCKVKKKARGRGPTQCIDVWNNEGKIHVSTNEFGQPIGPEAPKFICFLGTIARNGLIAPLNYMNWKAVPDENKESMWQLVEKKFSIDLQSKDSIMKSIGTKWKNWKALLKANHYSPHETDEERLADCDERVQPDQWRILVSYWNSSEAKERSNTNKANRSKYTSNHACGSKSFARVREEQRIKRPEGKEPSQADLFIVTRTRKNGQPVNEASSAIISQLRDAAKKQGTSPKDTIEDDIYIQVMGEEIRTPGVGPTLSNLKTSKPLPVEAMRVVSEANAEVREMREKMVAMEQTCATMATQIATMMTMMQKKFSDNENTSKSS